MAKTKSSSQRERGTLLRDKPYSVRMTGTTSVGITLQAGIAKAGDKYYEESFEDGRILLIPESIFEKEQEEDENKK